MTCPDLAKYFHSCKCSISEDTGIHKSKGQSKQQEGECDDKN